MTLIPFTKMDLEGKSSVESFLAMFSNLNYPGVKSIENELNEKYKKYIDQLKGNDGTSNYTYLDGNLLCDSFITDYVDGRNMSNFKNTNVDFEEFYNFCLRVSNETLGEIMPKNNKTLSYIQGSPSMELLVNYAKLAVDEYIESSSSNSEIKKSSSKKMLIVSGHDSTLSSQQLFIINSLGKNLEFYRYPTFASQLAFEITRKDDNKSKRDYSDYFINYYFNDGLLLNMTLSEFFNKIEPNIQTNNDNSNNGNNNENASEKKNYLNAPLAFFASLLIVSLLLNFFYIFK